LRDQLSLVLPFGSRSLNDYLAIILEPGLCAASFRWFCFFGNLAILIIHLVNDFRPLGFASPDFPGFALFGVQPYFCTKFA